MNATMASDGQIIISSGIARERSAIKQAGHFFLPAPLPASSADPDDEIFIECAVTAQAEYLVTGDKGHLLNLKHAGGI